ncbi:MAG: hypothetical protein LBT27_06360 [Prevotellaceae bacterium]|jgi:hypothetical protein|nr:hypothetical protein [Prevotellaceae bacterium]
MNNIIFESIQNIQEPLRTETMIYFLTHVLKRNFFVCWFKKEPELYRKANDIIKLKELKAKDNDKFMENIKSFQYSSSVKNEITKLGADINTVKDYVSDVKNKYIETVFKLKIVEKLIRTDKRRYATSVIMSMFSIIGGVIGAIIGTAIGADAIINLFGGK